MRKKTGRAGGTSRGEETRDEIIAHAMRVAAVEGLGALSIGRLAKELKITKSGLFVHFGSKAQLENAIIDWAQTIFFNRVVLPSQDRTRGIERVWALCDSWLEFMEVRVIPGGYFFTGAFFERADQDGPIANRVRDIANGWLMMLKHAVAEARDREEIRSEVDPKKIAFELHSLLLGAQFSRLLEQKDFTRAREAILSKLGDLATEEIPTEAFESEKAWNKYLDERRK